MSSAARRHRTAPDALADAAEGESVIYLAGAFLVTTADGADDLAAAGVPFARLRLRHGGRRGSEVVLVPAGDDG